ncbi:MAG: hypothetical protein Ct9H300mP18_12570 [Candidatus Neomarinimicrobiota bacterium]|nr:MAG: hypothetical protein Ct9H300mP18_12570 [Candidatus Neomarinimicrobiota bacterium]
MMELLKFPKNPLIEEVYKKLISVADKEEKIIQRIKNGETTCEIF